LDQARANGASAAVVRRGTPAVDGVPYFEVADTLDALGLLARARRRRLAPGSPVVAVTGSSGKTSTKEMIRAVLATTYQVHATSGNLNNLVGVPLTILAAPDDADALVVEAGASVPGEIARLRAVIEPTIAVITNVGYAHVEGFGSLAGVMQEKLALVEGARMAVVGTDPPELASEARRRAPTVVAGTGPGAQVRPDAAELDDGGHPRITWRQHAVTLPVVGFHQIENAMLALAVGREAPAGRGGGGVDVGARARECQIACGGGRGYRGAPAGTRRGGGRVRAGVRAAPGGAREAPDHGAGRGRAGPTTQDRSHGQRDRTAQGVPRGGARAGAAAPELRIARALSLARAAREAAHLFQPVQLPHVSRGGRGRDGARARLPVRSRHHPAVARAQRRPGDPRRGTGEPPREARHANHGRADHHPRDRCADAPVGAARQPVRRGGGLSNALDGRDRIHRRLPEDRARQVPGVGGAVEAHRPGHIRRGAGYRPDPVAAGAGPA